MRKQFVRIVAVACVAAIASVLSPAAAAAQEPETRLMRVTNVSLESAYTLALNVCSGAGHRRVVDENGEDRGFRPNCNDVNVLEAESMLAISATPAVIAQIEGLLAELDRAPETRAFHIVVLAASRSGAGGPELPAAARQALDDVGDFLPYTSFEILGSGWMRTSREATATLPGPEEFIAELAFRPSRDAAAPLLIEHFNIYRREPMSQAAGGAVTMNMVRRPILQTTFTVARGETVVVGTSKLNGGDDALIVLLTAVQD